MDEKMSTTPVVSLSVYFKNRVRVYSIDNSFSVRGPCWSPLFTWSCRNGANVGTRAVHHIDVAVSFFESVKGYLAPVRRPPRGKIVRMIVRQLLRLASGNADFEKVLIAVEVGIINEPLAVASSVAALYCLIARLNCTARGRLSG